MLCGMKMKGEDDMNVLVAGATGYLGRYMVNELVRHGLNVRVLVRDASKLDDIGPYHAPTIDRSAVEIFEGDVTNRESIQGVCKEMDLVISAVGLTRNAYGHSFYDVDYMGNKHLLEEAEQSGVQKFTYIHVLHGEKTDANILRAKIKFCDELKRSSIPSVVIRPTGYFSDLTNVLKMAKSGWMFLVGNGQARMNPIHGSDLAAFTVHQSLYKVGEFDVGGPQTFTYDEIAKLALRVQGRSERVFHLPSQPILLFARFLALFRPHQADLIKFFVLSMSTNGLGEQFGERELESFFRQYKLLEENEEVI